MTKLVRKVLKQFAKNAPATELTALGTQAQIPPLNRGNYKSTDPDVLQSISTGWERGLYVNSVDAEVTDELGNTKTVKVPIVNELNSVFMVLGYFVSYLYQNGLCPEYISTQDYYANTSFCSFNGRIYKSKTGTDTNPNVGNPLPTFPNEENTNWVVFYDPNWIATLQGDIDIINNSIDTINTLINNNDATYYSTFFKKDGSVAIGGSIDMGNNKIINGTPGTQPRDFVTVSQLPIITPTLNPKCFAVNDASQDPITSEPNFITSPTTKLLQIDGVTESVISTYYDGTRGIINTLETFDTSALGLATARVIILEEGIINFNVLDSIITESNLPPTGGVDGNYWIQTNPLKTYKRIGGVWTLTRFVKLGEYPTSAAGIVGTVRCYAFNRQSTVTVLATNSAPMTFQHNLGVKPINLKFGMIKAICLIADGTYNVNDVVYGPLVTNSGGAPEEYNNIYSASNNSLTMQALSSAGDNFIIGGKNGFFVSMTAGRWNFTIDFEATY